VRVLNLTIKHVSWEVNFVVEQLHHEVPHLVEDHDCEDHFVDGSCFLEAEKVEEKGSVEAQNFTD